MKKKSFIIVILSLLLILSFGANIWLYRMALGYYKDIQILRLDPVGSPGLDWTDGITTKEARPSPARIILFGDSRIALWNPMPSIEDGIILNCGVSSQTTSQMLLRLEQDVLELNPDIVVIQAGVNDLKTIGVLPERTDQIVDLCCRNLESIIRKVCDNGIHAVVLTVFQPASAELIRKPVWSEQIYSAVSEVNSRIKALPYSPVTVIDCDPILSKDGRINPKYAYDTLHLNSAGYGMLNGVVQPVLEDLLKTSQK
jgi:lysophospholipase L1-like esterase